MSSKRININLLLDLFAYVFTLTNLMYFAYLFRFDKVKLNVVLREDYIFEWATFAFLLLISLTFIIYAYQFRKYKFYFVVFVSCALVFIFGACEEVSWFQRILDFKGAEFITGNNSQHEFNLHNLKVGSFSVNKMIFGKILGILIGMFYLIPSLVKELSDSGRLFLKGIFFPTPYMKDLILCLIIISTVYLYLNFPKQGEILEYLLSFQMFSFFLREYLSYERIL